MIDLLDPHTHTLASGHAYNTIREMARAASEKNLSALGITEHGPELEGSCTWLYFSGLDQHPREMFGVRLFMGIELNILDGQGHVDLADRELNRLDYAIASLHDLVYGSGTPGQNTNACINAMRIPKVKILGHPDDSKLPLEYERLVRAAKDLGVLLEVNNNSLRPNSYREGGRENCLKMLSLCAQFETPVILSSDAHMAENVGNHIYAQEMIRLAGFPERLIMNDSVERFAAFCGLSC